MACTGKVSTLADLPLHSAFLELFCPITSVVLLPPKVHSVEFMIIYLLTYNLILYIIIKIIIYSYMGAGLPSTESAILCHHVPTAAGNSFFKGLKT